MSLLSCLGTIFLTCLFTSTAYSQFFPVYDEVQNGVQQLLMSTAHYTSPTMSIEILFNSGSMEQIQNIKHGAEFSFPSDFARIKIECKSPYPKRWTFSTILTNDNNIPRWFIDKTRLVPGTSIHDPSTYSFITDLVLEFAQKKQHPLQYTFNCKYLDARDDLVLAKLSSYITLNTNLTSLSVLFMEGQYKPPSLNKYGKNANCSLTLHLDRVNKKFGCTHNYDYDGSQKILSSIVACNDPDECTSMVQTNTNCPNSIVETCEMSTCTSFKYRWNSGIFICETGQHLQDGLSSTNSMAAIFYFTLNPPRKLYLNKEPAKANETLDLQLVNASAEVYSESSPSPSLWFNCTGSAAYFSQGFFWILEFDNWSITNLGSESNTSSYLEEAQVYSTLKEIHFLSNRPQIIRVYCLGPRWNSFAWENVSRTITFKVGKSPYNFDSNVSNPLKTKIIVALALSFLAVLLLLILLGLTYNYRRKSTRNGQSLTQDEIHDFLHGDPEVVDNALFYPYNTEYEIARSQFHIESKILGDGQFGHVTKGRIGRAPVAIKTVKKSANILYLKALLSELKIMCFVGRHEYIVSLIGACTESIDKREVYLLVEYCENGNLLDYLKLNRQVFVNYLEEASQNVVKNHHYTSKKHKSLVEYQNATVKKLSSRDLVRWSCEIATGMEHLSYKNVIHGDLAARNILLNKNLVAKVGDFGLSKQLYDYSVYVQRIECPLPLRWLAIESLQDLEFSKESDVWSYGVVLWEIYSLGRIPYPGMEWDFDSWKLIKDGFRMQEPEYASNEIYGIMLDCWNIDPGARPHFGDMREFFQELSLKMDPQNVNL